MQRGALGSELDGNSTERRAIWSREDPSLLNTVDMVNPSFSNYKNCGIVLISKGLCSHVTPL